MELLPIVYRAAIFFLVVYFVIWPIYSAYRFSHPARLKVAFFTPTTLGVSYEDVSLISKDGIELEGWFIPSRNGAAVLLLHGLGSNRIMMVEYAEALLKAGYGILMFDMRAHGNSGGRKFARSQQEVDDVLTAVAYLTKRRDVNAAGIGVMGVSIGGLFALQAAAQSVAIRAVFVDGASPAVFADLPKPKFFWQQIPLWVERFYMKVTDWFTGKAHLPSNLTIIPKIAPRSLFIVSAGTGPERRLAQSYFAAAGEPKEWWEIPEASHARGWQARPQIYHRKLVGFFDRALVTQSKTRIILPEIPDNMEESED